MHHFLYVTRHTNGKFYVGRHSTDNIEDGYLGSGKWIRSIKNKSNLKREIIGFYDNETNLREAEQELLTEVIDLENNMNFSNSSCGFSTGNRNPSNDPLVKSKKKNWMQTKEGRRWASENNPSKKLNVKKQRSEFARKQFEKNQHNFQIFYEKRISNLKIRMKINNPMFDSVVKKKVSDRLKEQYDGGTHNFQIYKEDPTKRSKRMKENNPMKNPEVSSKHKKPKPKVTCPHCSKTGGKPVMVRYHFDKCNSLV